ncbi:hypothetical protein ACFPLB_04730 [Aquamicrobium segne]|uniref:Lipoprotein n=1 Tax=Aquamicrobium segne TaxID=469547 RepID=A0ABW0GWK2_9HYPH
MVVATSNFRFFTGFAFAGLMLVMAGCQSGSSDALSVQGRQGADASGEKILASELRAYCPTLTLREGTAYFNTYAKGGQDDPDKIVYQASISEVTRDCKRANGQLTMNVAAAGRIVPGPQATAGAITMPIRVVVTRGSEVLYSQLHQHKVQVSDTSSATQFVFNDANVTVPDPSARDYQVFVGYDEGPPKAKAQDKPRPVARRKTPAPAAARPAQAAPAAPAPSETTSASDIPR